MLVKQLLPEICHFIHTYREGHQHAAELRASASAVLFSLSCNNFNAVFSRISTRCSSSRSHRREEDLSFRTLVASSHQISFLIL